MFNNMFKEYDKMAVFNKSRVIRLYCKYASKNSNLKDQKTYGQLLIKYSSYSDFDACNHLKAV